MADYTESQLENMSDEELETAANEASMNAELEEADTSVDDSYIEDDNTDDSGDEPEVVDDGEPIIEDDKSKDNDGEPDDEVEDKDSEISDDDKANLDEEAEPKEDDNEEAISDTPIEEFRDLKVDGKMIPIKSMDEIYALASGGGNLTQKYQRLAGHKKAIAIMQQHNITDEDLSVLAQIRSGNKDALANLVKKSGIDYLDITDEVSNTYNPNEFVPSDVAVSIQEIQDEISVDPEYSITQNVVNNMFDDSSRDMLVENPAMIKGLHQDIKNGVFEQVQAEAYKLKMMTGGIKSDMEYYIEAAQSGAAENVPTMNNNSQQQNQVEETVSKKQVNSNKKSKRSAGSTKAKIAPKTVVDVNEMTDEELEAYRTKIMDAY